MIAAELVERGRSAGSSTPPPAAAPACVLTRQAAIPILNSVLVAPATRIVRDIPTEIALTRRRDARGLRPELRQPHHRPQGAAEHPDHQPPRGQARRALRRP